MEQLETMVKAVQDYVRRCMAPFGIRLKSIEDRIASGEFKGERGNDGVDGKDGAAGRDGVDGKDGAPGDPGEKGLPGDVGIDGKPGRDGADGKDGAPGDRGGQGPRGEKGDTGERGAPGERGEKGEAGSDGTHGQKGDPGLDGRDGLEGTPGKDALQIDVLDGIEPTRRYQRGTYASHRGGILRAFKATEPLADGELERCGWQVIVNGIDAEDETCTEDGRTITRMTRYTNGKEMVRTFKTAAILDRGIYKPDVEYAKGDGVTFGGSWWLAQKDAPEGKPGECDAWRLTVKRGRDGKDGVVKDEPARGPVRVA